MYSTSTHNMMPPGGRYTQLRTLSKTMGGRVIVARDTRTNNLVAVKFSHLHTLKRLVSISSLSHTLSLYLGPSVKRSLLPHSFSAVYAPV